ncbi:LLM class flavin-dependent oxidoreductase [Paenibacillus sp. IB182496]|uniref:LLM class flavin-dependent oxidoreductase n=1 Tax=Paenibacillus sabuli TaxID=2772509 RepID=A0A927GU86_9BACL|nr:LLM class flavin-dependent oxidoreductase [Paenibacillus sabuli]MBD2848669.1 LLM class flavin-dependent oxidoreductase [Paenibacillus sabuli]
MTGNHAGRMLHLNVFVHGTGHHEAAWRHPGVVPEQTLDLAYYRGLAEVAERGRLDSLFVSDAYFGIINKLEATTLLGALAESTQRIGLIATVGTTYCEPYHLAAQLATLDRISGGRAGWNIVTSSADGTAANFGRARHPDHSERYRMAGEFVEAVKWMWQGGAAFDGEYYRAQGPYRLPVAPQGYPVLVQAGSSESGRAMGARIGEVIFTAQQTYEAAHAFYADMKGRLAGYGRSPEELVIMPGLCPIVADTEAEARELEAELGELIDMPDALRRLSTRFDADLAGYPLDGPVPLERAKAPESINALRSRQQLLLDLARDERMTLRQFVHRFAAGRGHFAFAGTAVQLADELERWFREGAADGFNIMPQLFPGGLETFVDKVVPELQERGLFRIEYEGATLREHLGLRHPLAEHV